MTEEISDWKMKLQCGKLTTPFEHFTVLADGVVGKLREGFRCRPGRAWMAMRTWATDQDESADMIQVIGSQIRFMVDGRIMIYDETNPEHPPENQPYGYDIGFTPYDGDAQPEN